eukprot:279099-Hanusia_phi.AAC.2
MQRQSRARMSVLAVTMLVYLPCSLSFTPPSLLRLVDRTSHAALETSRCYSRPEVFGRARAQGLRASIVGPDEKEKEQEADAMTSQPLFEEPQVVDDTIFDLEVAKGQKQISELASLTNAEVQTLQKKIEELRFSLNVYLLLYDAWHGHSGFYH